MKGAYHSRVVAWDKLPPSLAMSNIFTESVRLWLRPGVVLAPADVEALLERILGERGSYWVPVWYDAGAPGCLDLQYGSGKSASVHNLEPEDLELFDQIWVRFADEGADVDELYEWTLELGGSTFDGHSRRRPCRYGFDEVRVFGDDKHLLSRLPADLPWEEAEEGLRAPCVGSYFTLNNRMDMEVGPHVRLGTGAERTPGGLPTPTTPCHAGRPLTELRPAALEALAKEGDEAARRVEFLHAGRVVHRAAWGGRRERASAGNRWIHLCADDWDNCVDEALIRLRCEAW